MNRSLSLSLSLVLACSLTVVTAPAIAEALQCEGKLLRAANVEYSKKTLFLELQIPETNAGGTMRTSDELLGQAVQLAADPNPAVFNAVQTNGKTTGANTFYVSKLLLFRNSGTFEMQAILMNRNSPMPMMSVDWTGTCKKDEGGKRLF